MTSSIVARRYAQALFSLGHKSGLSELERYAESLSALRSALAASSDLDHLFRSPIIATDDKAAVVKKLAHKLDIAGAVKNFRLLLAEKNRLDHLSAIADAFSTLLDAEKGVLRGTIVTAVPLDAPKQAAVLAKLEAKAGRSLMLEFGVAPEILGGVVLTVGDKVMDASLKAQLSILKDTIKRGE